MAISISERDDNYRSICRTRHWNRVRLQLSNWERDQGWQVRYKYLKKKNYIFPSTASCFRRHVKVVYNFSINSYCTKDVNHRLYLKLLSKNFFWAIFQQISTDGKHTQNMFSFCLFYLSLRLIFWQVLSHWLILEESWRKSTSTF